MLHGSSWVIFNKYQDFQFFKQIPGFCRACHIYIYIYIYYNTFLFVRCCSYANTLAAPQSMVCLLLFAWTANPFLMSLVLTAYWSSFILRIVLSHLHTHCYSLCRELHRLLLSCCDLVLVVFTFTNNCLRVFSDSLITCTPRGWQMCSIFSLMVLMYGVSRLSEPLRLVRFRPHHFFCRSGRGFVCASAYYHVAF